MKKSLKLIVFLVIGLLFGACGQVTTATPLPIPSPTITAKATATLTLIPSLTAMAQPTSRPEFVPPTLIPTIDPTLVPSLLSKAFSIQRWPGINSYLQQITGWDYGFERGWQGGYEWLDPNHLILYPIVGQQPSMSTLADDLAPQPVVINRNTGSSWLPDPGSAWSKELGMFISPGFSSSAYDYSDKNAVFTYTFDGQDVAFFWGKLLDVSPSGTKILVDDDTIIDLRNNKIIELAWYMNYDIERSSELYWTTDETRVYRCCYYFADLTSGRSYSFNLDDLRQSDGRPGPSSILPHAYGEWVRNDTYFLVEWSWIDDGDIGYLPMFSPSENKYYDVREMAGIPEEWHCHQTMVSPDGTYVWMTGWGEKEEGSYLVNLFSFESHYFPGKEYLNIDWSPNGKFAWLYNSNPTDDSEEYSILSVADLTIRLLPVKSQHESGYWWHPTKDIVAYLSEDQSALIFWDGVTGTTQKLTLYSDLRNLVWSPNGEKIVFAANNGVLWQVGYPKLDNLKRITPPYYNVDHLKWSPDSNSIAFTTGPDIYIVETVK